MKKLIVTILFVWLSVGVYSELWAQVSARSLGFDKSASREIFQLSTAPPASFDSTSVEEDEEELDPLDCGKVRPSRVYVGGILTVNYGMLQDFKPSGLYNNTLTELSGETTIGFSSGIRCQYQLGKVKNPNGSITADFMIGELGYTYLAQDSLPSTTSEKMLGQYRFTIAASAFTINALYNFRIPSTFLRLTAGISTNYIFNVEHSYRVTASKEIFPSTSTVSTSDSGRTVQYADASSAEVNRLQFGIIAGLRYDILLRRSVLMPFAQFEYGLNGVFKGGQARPTIVRAGCAWIFAI
ncbi:MAG: outer membrane beta-barrel protein [Candidatus Kapaibacterium sp.]